MRQYLIFSIFVCWAAAVSIEGRVLNKQKEKVLRQQCIREYNVDEKKYENGVNSELLVKYPREAMCMLSCGIRKSFTKSVTGSNHKERLYNGFTNIIDLAYKSGFEKEEVEFTHEEVNNRIKQCYNNEKDECDFFKCFYDFSLFKMLVFVDVYSDIFR